MKSGGKNQVSPREKHTQIISSLPFPGNVFIFCVDKRGRISWCSTNPDDKMVQRSIVDDISPEDHVLVENALSKVVIRGEPTEYIVVGGHFDGMPMPGLVRWRVKLFPCGLIDTPAIGVCARLP